MRYKRQSQTAKRRYAAQAAAAVMPDAYERSSEENKCIHDREKATWDAWIAAGGYMDEFAFEPGFEKVKSRG